MKALLLLALFLLASCGGIFSSDSSSYVDRLPPKIEIEPFFVVVGDFPEGVSPKDFQIVAYKNTPVKSVVPYKYYIDYRYALKTGGFDFKNPIPSYEVLIDEFDPATEIVWYNKGVPYQTLNIEYTIKKGDIVSFKAFWNGKQELCLNNYIGTSVSRIYIHMPDNRQPESEWFTIFKDNPKCRETEKYKYLDL